MGITPIVIPSRDFMEFPRVDKSGNRTGVKALADAVLCRWCDFVMPNWCSNKLFVKNLKTEDQDLLLRLFDQETFCESILPQPDWANTPNEKGELPLPDEDHPELGRRFPDGTHDDRWYSWRNENWGTKWGECDVFGAEVGNGGWFSVAYLTAWSPLNENFLKAFSQRFPGARISTQYQESGCDFMGSVARTASSTALDGCLSTSATGGA